MTAYYNHTSTFIEIGGLIFLIGAAMMLSHKTTPQKITNIPFTKIMYASILAMFAYSGFETTVKLTEEAKDPEDIPKAIILSVISACVIYILVAIVSVNLLNHNTLASSSQPIAELANLLFGTNMKYAFFVIAMFSISNTLLVSLLGSSRMLHGIAAHSPYLSIFRKVDETTKTPIIATIAVALASILCLFIKNVEKTAAISSYLLFIVFIIVNICLIMLYNNEDKREKLKKSWTHGINQGKPILPTLGLLASLAMIIFGFHDVFQ